MNSARAGLAVSLLAVVTALPGISQAQPLEFDAASVKLADASLPRKPFSGGPGTNTPGRYSGRGLLIELIQTAHGVQYDEISGGPAWLRSGQRYEIDATMPPSTAKQDFEAMLRNLLIQRFHVAVHRETQNFPAFDLVAAKGGSKLKKSVAAAPGNAVPASSDTGPDGFPVMPPGPHTAQVLSHGNLRYKLQERSMEYFASLLGFLINRAVGAGVDEKRPRVIDKTGLPGTFDFTFEFACPDCVAAAPVSGAPADDAAAPSIGPDIFSALEDQLGLKAVKAPGVGVSVVIVDRVDRVPTSN